VPERCEQCNHPPIRHVVDGKVSVCLVCLLLARENPSLKVCIRLMNFKLSQAEREQAANADRESWPPTSLCANCFYSWEQHMGYLCPTGDSTFILFLDAGADYHA
jgi:hypothetical protein